METHLQRRLAGSWPLPTVGWPKRASDPTEAFDRVEGTPSMSAKKKARNATDVSQAVDEY